MKIYTFKEAAAVLGLKTASGVSRRMGSMAQAGKGLGEERGEIVWYGGKRVLTEKGVEKLKKWKGRKAGRPSYKQEEMESKEGIKG